MPRYLALPGRAAGGPWRPGQRLSRVIPTRTADSVHRLARAQRTTASAVLMAACGITLSAASGQRRLVIGTPASGRDRPELQHTLGAFLNVLPIGVDLTGDPSFGELTRQVAARLGRATDHQDLPFSQLVAALAPPRAFPRMPLVQACFTYRPSGSLGALDFAGCDITEVVPPTAKGKFELTLRVDELRGRPEAWAEFDVTLLDPAAARRLLAGFVRVLEAALAAPGSAASWLAARAGLSRPPGDASGQARGGPVSGRAPEVGCAGPEASPSAEPAEPIISAARLAALAAEVLGFSADPTADLFMSGANSLLIAVLVWRIEAEAGCRIGLRDVCQTPTLAVIAGLLPSATQARQPLVTRQGRENEEASDGRLGPGS
jgi:hypothetical protein